MPPLTAKRRSELRAQAHKLSPIVLIGDKGLTDEVLAEIDRSLTAHELIKVRAATAEREARDAWLEKICERLQAHPVQQIGKVFVVYRENPPQEKQEKRERKPREKPVASPPPPARVRRKEASATAKQRSRAEDRERNPRARSKAPAPRRRRPRSA